MLFDWFQTDSMEQIGISSIYDNKIITMNIFNNKAPKYDWVFLQKIILFASKLQSHWVKLVLILYLYFEIYLVLSLL